MFGGQKRAYSCVVLLVGLWCGGTAYAEPLQDHLTVSDVLMLAAESDARMGEADQLAIAAQHAITRETKGERPYFRFVASAEAIEDSDPFRREGELYSAKLEAGQTVYSFGRAGATRAAAQAGYDRFAAARSLTEQDIMLEAAQKAIAVMAAYDRLQVQARYKKVHDRRLEDSEASEGQKLASITDLRQVRARQGQAYASLLLAKDRFAGAQLDLFKLTLSGFAAKVLTFAVGVDEVAAPTLPALMTAIVKGPELAKLSSDAARASADYDRSKADRFPDISVQGSIQSAEIDGSDADTSRIGIQFSVPLYEGGALSAQISERAALKKAAEYRLDYARRALLIEVKNAWAGLGAARAAYAAWETALEDRKAALNDIKAETDKGMRPVSDLYDFEQATLEDELQLIGLRFDVLERCFVMLRLAGLLDGDSEAICAALSWPTGMDGVTVEMGDM